MGALQGLWSYIMTLGGLIPENTQITGNAVIDSILKVMAFMATLPEQIAMYLINIIAESLGFGENFCQNMISGAANAVSGFLEWIGQLPVQVEENLAAVVTSTVTWLTSLWESITTITLQIADALAFPFVNIGLIVYESLMTVWSVITGILGSIWASVSAFGQNFSMTMMTAAMNAVNGFVSWISQLPGRAWTQLSQVISRATSFASSFASQMMHAGTNAVTQFTNSIRNLSNGFLAELQEIISAATNFVGEIGSILYNAGANAIQNFLSGLGRHSPGIMQREFVAEINEMGERVPNESRLLLSNVGKLGENIVDEFGEPTLGVKFDDTANASFSNLTDGQTRANVINLNLEIGSVDNEDRIQEIVEAVRRELAWNNLLAGRNVDDIS
jgi:phage-related protein